MTITSKNKKAEILEAYLLLLEENQMLQNELIKAHKMVYPMPLNHYSNDIAARYKITKKEVHLLLEDITKFIKFIRENSVHFHQFSKIEILKFSPIGEIFFCQFFFCENFFL